jgi:GH15 family glucan-1,4-alpha-glucosidase
VPIAGYACIGNCRTAALISRHGSIDWYCPGRFDAPAVFCRMLDADRGGFASLAPVGDFAVDRAYVDDTNILLTTYRGEGVGVQVSDFMSVDGDPQRARSDPPYLERIVRRVEVTNGDAEINLRFKPTFDYARDVGVPRRVEGGVMAGGDGAYLGFAAQATFQMADGGVWQASMRLRRGDVRLVTLVYGDDPHTVSEAMGRQESDDSLSGTRSFWQTWAGRCTYDGPYRFQVLRSALTLKLMTYEPTGAIVAAPTTSLPEQIGGVRNWDYRYTWLRDSSLILYALLTVGYHEEAAHFIRWLRNVLHGHLREAPQIMYTIDGRHDIPERQLEYLDGYRSSRPVRVGNAAAKQRQLDIYGEVIIAAYIHYHRPEGHERAPLSGSTGPDEETWRVISALVDDAARWWGEPDNFPQGFTHLALIRSAVDLARGHRHGAEEHRTTEGERAPHARRVASSRRGQGD